MNRKKIKSEIKDLKKDLNAVNRASDSKLVKLALTMVILAIVAAFIYGRVQL